MNQTITNSDQYWAYDDWQNWAAELDPLLDTIYDRSVLQRFNEAVLPNWLQWLDDQQFAINGSAPGTEQIQAHLADRFLGLRVYHATRLKSLSDLRELGLRAWTPLELSQLAQRTFENHTQDQALLAKCIHCANPTHRGGRVYTFRTLSDALPGKCVCFAKSGSEWLEAVASCVGITGYVKTIRETTQPYLVACNIPWQLLGPDNVHWLAKEALLTIITSRYFAIENYTMPCRSGVSISIDHSIPPEHITGVAELSELIDRDDLTADLLTWTKLGSPCS